MRLCSMLKLESSTMETSVPGVTLGPEVNAAGVARARPQRGHRLADVLGCLAEAIVAATLAKKMEQATWKKLNELWQAD